MMRTVLSVLIAVTVFASAQAEEPQWLTEARAKEGALGAPASIRSEDGAFTALVPFKVTGKIVEESGSYSVAFLMAPDQEADCEVYPDVRDPANHLNIVAKSIFANQIEKRQGKVEFKGVEFSEAGAIAHGPYLEIRWIYRVYDGKAARVGGVSQFFATKQGHSISCSFASLGYTKIFQTAVHALVESITFNDKKAPPTPFYTDLSVVRLGSVPIGFSFLTLERDADGDVKAASTTAMLIQRTPGELVARDSTRVEFTDASGKLINAVHAIDNNGEMDADLALQYAKDHWQVTGKFHGKDLTASLVDPPLVNTWLGQAFRIKAAMKAEAKEAKEMVSSGWTEIDPTTFVEEKLIRLTSARPGQPNFQVSMAGVVVPLTVDPATGQGLKAVVPAGPQTMTIERIDVSGSY